MNPQPRPLSKTISTPNTPASEPSATRGIGLPRNTRLMSTATTTLTPQAQALQQLAQQQLDQGPDWLRALRTKALEKFADLGLPTRFDEEWRYTDPAPLTKLTYSLPADASVTAEQVASFAIPDLTADTLVFVDGKYAPEHTRLSALPAGAVVLSLSEAFESHRELIEAHLASEGEASSKAFTLLNAAMASDGVFVFVPKGAAIETPIHVLNIATATDQPVITNPRTIIVAQQSSEVTVIEHYVALTDGAYFTNAVTQLDAAQNAVVNHYLIEQESEQAYQISTLLTDQQRDSDVRSHTVLFGGKLVRNNVNPRLNAENCECLVNGLYVGRDQQHMDNHMRVEHNKPHGDSRQFYKGVLSGKAHAVFSGRIVVAQEAQKTDAKQTNANLLLSDTASATAKPQLEIYADDVKCTHGATIGQIDEEAIFYLMARGVTKEAAHGMMVFAFAAESFERMTLEPVRRMLGKELLKRLPEGDKIEAMLS